MSFSQYTTLPLFLIFAFSVLSSILAEPHDCTQDFLLHIHDHGINQSCHAKGGLLAEFGWNFDNDTRHLDIVFGARLDAMTGWLAWGLNLDRPGMVGTQALIGIKYPNASLSSNKYNITGYTKLGCQLYPSDDIGLDIRDFSFGYVSKIGYYVIRATIILPFAFNSSRTNIVYQVGESVTNIGPMMHPISLKHLDTADTLDLISNNPVSYLVHERDRLRKVHGVLNIVGLGTILPLGAIIARYFKEFPFTWSWWNALHVFFQLTGFTAGFVGWVIGLWLGNASKYYCFRFHRTLGIIIFVFLAIQVLAFRLIPTDVGENRKYWNMYHHSLGYTLLVLISINIFHGINILENHDVWKWSYIGVLGVLAFLALSLELISWFKVCFRRHRQNNSPGNPDGEDRRAKPSRGEVTPLQPRS